METLTMKELQFIPQTFYVIVQEMTDGSGTFVKEIWTRSKDDSGNVAVGRPYEISRTDELQLAKKYDRLDDALVVIYALNMAFQSNPAVHKFHVFQFEETLKHVDSIP
jgi:hypothetical protein